MSGNSAYLEKGDMAGLLVGLDFQDLFQKTVMATLSRILGESATKSLLYHAGFGPRIDDTTEFHLRLTRLLGEQGIEVLEMSIIKALFAALSAPVPTWESGFDFEKQVRLGRDMYLGSIAKRSVEERI